MKKAEIKLKKLGHHPVNPHKIHERTNEIMAWEWYMKTDSEFRVKFNNVYEDCYLDDESVHLLDEDALIKEVFSLTMGPSILNLPEIKPIVISP